MISVETNGLWSMHGIWCDWTSSFYNIVEYIY